MQISTRRFVWTFRAALLGCALCPTVFAATPATAPATTAAAAIGDPHRATPDKTWATMCDAIKAGDLSAFRACCFNRNEMSSVFMEAYSDTVITTFQLAATVSDLGDDGKQLSKSLETSYNDLVNAGQNRRTDIDGNEAAWVQVEKTGAVSTQRVMYFKKVDGDWLLDTEHCYSLDTAEGRRIAEEFIASSTGQMKLLKGIIADIKAKKITTVDQMRDRFSGK